MTTGSPFRLSLLLSEGCGYTVASLSTEGILSLHPPTLSGGGCEDKLQTLSLCIVILTFPRGQKHTQAQNGQGIQFHQEHVVGIVNFAFSSSAPS